MWKLLNLSEWGLIVLYALGVNMAAECWLGGVDFDKPDAPSRVALYALIVFWPLTELWDLITSRLYDSGESKEK